MQESISARIKQLLAESGDTQNEMCRKTGIQKSALSNYLSGFRVPRQDKISAIADAYHVNPAWVLGYDVPQKKELSSSQAIEDFELLDKWHRLNDLQKQAVKLTIDNFLGLLPLPEVTKK